MSELSHEGAFRLFVQGRLSEAERMALSSHLRTCPACRRSMAVDSALQNHLVLQTAKTRPSPQFTAVYMESATRRSRMNHLLKPLSTAAGLAMMLLIVLAGWFIIKSTPLTDTSPETVQQLFDAVLAGDTITVERLLSVIAGPNIRDSEGNALLPVAARSGNLKTVQLLIDSGADVNMTMKPYGAGKTALMEAAIGNRGEIIERLVAAGANINQQERETGWSALHFAAYLGPEKAVTSLLELGADPDIKAQNGQTPLHFAATYRYLTAFRLLIENGADVNATDNDGLTPMMSVILRGDPIDSEFITMILIRNGADPNLQDNLGNSALHYAAKMNLVDTISALLERGADPNLQNHEGQTPLDLAKYSQVRERLLSTVKDAVESEGEPPSDRE